MSNHYKDELWADFAEDELDGALAAEMKQSLEKYPENRKINEGFRISKRLVRRAGETDVRLTEEYFDQLHNKIMSRVQQESMGGRTFRPTIAAHGGGRWVRVTLSAAAVLVAIVSAFAVVQWFRPANVAIPIAKEDRALSYEHFLQASKDSPDVYAQSIAHVGTDEDLLYEVAETRLQGLTDQEFAAFMNR